MAAAAAAAVGAVTEAAASLEDLFHTHPIVGSLSIPPHALKSTTVYWQYLEITLKGGNAPSL